MTSYSSNSREQELKLKSVEKREFNSSRDKSRHVIAGTALSLRLCAMMLLKPMNSGSAP